MASEKYKPKLESICAELREKTGLGGFSLQGPAVKRALDLGKQRAWCNDRYDRRWNFSAAGLALSHTGGGPLLTTPEGARCNSGVIPYEDIPANVLERVVGSAKVPAPDYLAEDF